MDRDARVLHDWRMVPREPTAEMIDATESAGGVNNPLDLCAHMTRDDMRNIWRAMYDAYMPV